MLGRVIDFLTMFCSSSDNLQAANQQLEGILFQVIMGLLVVPEGRHSCIV